MTEEATKLTHDPKLTIVGTPTPEAKITWHIRSNPRTMGKGTHTRFEKYFGSNTVGEYLASGGTKGDLLWDIRAGYLGVEGVTVGPAAADKPPRAPRAKKGEKAAAVASEDSAAAVATETIE